MCRNSHTHRKISNRPDTKRRADLLVDDRPGKFLCRVDTAIADFNTRSFLALPLDGNGKCLLSIINSCL